MCWFVNICKIIIKVFILFYNKIQQKQPPYTNCWNKTVDSDTIHKTHPFFLVINQIQEINLT